MFCTNCGSKIDERFHNCPICGAPVAQPVSAVSAEQPKPRKKRKTALILLICVVVLAAVGTLLALLLLGKKNVYKKLYQAVEDSVRMDSAVLSVTWDYYNETEEISFCIGTGGSKLQYCFEADSDVYGLYDGNVFHYNNRRDSGFRYPLSDSRSCDVELSLLAALCSGKLTDKEFLKNSLCAEADANYLGLSGASCRNAIDILYEKLVDEEWMNQSCSINVLDESDADVYDVRFRPRSFLDNCLRELKNCFDEERYQEFKQSVQRMDNDTIRLRITIQNGKITRIVHNQSNTEIRLTYSKDVLSSIYYEAEWERDTTDISIWNVNKRTFDQNEIKSILENCSENNIVGTYKIKSINGKDLKTYFKESFGALSEEGQEITDDQIEGFLKLMGINSMDEFVTFTLEEDGNFKTSMMGEEETGTWRLDGDKLIMTAGSESLIGTFNNGEITLEMDGESLVLRRN